MNQRFLNHFGNSFLEWSSSSLWLLSLVSLFLDPSVVFILLFKFKLNRVYLLLVLEAASSDSFDYYASSGSTFGGVGVAIDAKKFFFGFLGTAGTPTP